jgi:hypothetical protein
MWPLFCGNSFVLWWSGTPGLGRGWVARSKLLSGLVGRRMTASRLLKGGKESATALLSKVVNRGTGLKTRHYRRGRAARLGRQALQKKEGRSPSTLLTATNLPISRVANSDS